MFRLVLTCVQTTSNNFNAQEKKQMAAVKILTEMVEELRKNGKQRRCFSKGKRDQRLKLNILESLHAC